jgi:hypothetical protein
MVELTSKKQKQEIKNEVEILLQQRYGKGSRKETQDESKLPEPKTELQDLSCNSHNEGAANLSLFDLPDLNDTVLPDLNFEDSSAAPIRSAGNEATVSECVNRSVFDADYSHQGSESDLVPATFLESLFPQNLWDDFDGNSNYQMNTSCNGSSNRFHGSSISSYTKSSSMTSQEIEPSGGEICRCRNHTLECNTAVKGGNESCRCCSGWFSWSTFADPFFARVT